MSECKNGSCIATASMVFECDSKCGCDKCKGVVCTTKCVGKDLYKQVCLDGQCITTSPEKTNATECGGTGEDPCKNVQCNDMCEGDDLYSYRCADGKCVKDTLKEKDRCKINTSSGRYERDEEETSYISGGVEAAVAAFSILGGAAGVAVLTKAYRNTAGGRHKDEDIVISPNKRKQR